MKMAVLKSLVRALRGPMKPRIMTAVDLFMLMRTNDPNLSMSSFYERVKDLADIGDIKRVMKGLYVNNTAIPRVSMNEVAEHIHEQSVVTLHSALMHAGILNNPTQIVTCSIPVKPRGWRDGAKSKIKTDDGQLYWFFRMPERFVNCDGLATEDLYVQSVSYPLATAEKAFMDWMYLGASEQSGFRNEFSGLPPMDIEFGQMNVHRLRRIAAKMELTEELNDWLAFKKEYDSSLNVKLNHNASMGF